MASQTAPRRPRQLPHQPLPHPHLNTSLRIAGAAIAAVVAGKIFMRIVRFLSGGDSSDFKFVGNLEAGQIVKLAEELISKSQKVHDSVAAVPLEKVTYDNVIAPLVRLEAEEFALIQACKFPRLVSSSKDVQQASKDAENMLDAYKKKCSVRVDVYQVIKAFSQKNSNLKPEAQRYVNCLVKDFERQGLNLRPEIRDEAERLKARITELCNVFQNNVNEDETTLLFTAEELAGMHPNFIKGLDSDDGCKFTVTLKPCHYLPIMENCKISTTRSAVATARYQRCTKENIPILEKVLDLRKKLAKLLGYRNWGEYCLEVRMPRNPEKVKDFHDQMLQLILPRASQELKLLQDLKEEEEGDAAFGVDDILYYIRKAERRLLKYNINELDQYFPFEVVTAGLQKIYGHLLGLKFLEHEKKCVWHEDVREFSVIDSESRDVMGIFYLDPFSRDGKYSYSCVVPLQPSCELANGKRQLPMAALLMNLTKSVSDVPSLLKHSELVSYFHEFGHLMHHICSRASFARFSGLLVESDFLETPSQMFENWCYEKDSLKLMSCSYKDPEALIPESMLKFLKEKRRSFLALRTLRNHLFIGILDQIIHTEDKVNIEQVVKDLFPEVVLGMQSIEGTNIAASMLNLVAGGSDAVCYSYLWSEVFAADMFETRFKGNMMNNIAGLEYRNKVLAPGASKDALQILREFLGRDPSVGAYARLNGLNEVDDF